LSRDAALAIALLLLIDAFLIPGLARRRRAQESPVAPVEAHAPPVHEQGTGEDPTLGFTPALRRDRESERQGRGIRRLLGGDFGIRLLLRGDGALLFNSPTNWVHESMFLMYGMQYMISGAYAYRGPARARRRALLQALAARQGDRRHHLLVFFFIFT